MRVLVGILRREPIGMADSSEWRPFGLVGDTVSVIRATCI